MAIARLVFVHGRAQQGKSSEELIREWSHPLRGALASDAALLDQVEVVAPFYGDRLDQMTRELSDAVPDDVIVRGEAEVVDPAYRRFLGAYLDELRTREDITDDQIAIEAGDAVAERGPQNWRWVLAIIRALDNVPGLDGDMIERFLRDVWLYLERRSVRQAIKEIVEPAFATDLPIIVVAHSLGTVVAYDLLRQMQHKSVPLLVTLGSPLGLSIVKRALVPVSHPACVRKWFNARDVRDVVALYPLDASTFSVEPAIAGFDGVVNRTPNAHGIAGYLSDRTVANCISQAIASLR